MRERRTECRVIGIDHLVDFPARPIDADELPLTLSRARSDTRSGRPRMRITPCARERARATTNGSPVDSLRDRHRSAAPTTCSRGRTADGQSRQTPQVRPRRTSAARPAVELAEIDAARFRAAAHEEEKVPAVGQELREKVPPLLRRLDSCHGRRLAAVGRNAKDRPAGIVGKEDDAVAVPRPADWHGDAQTTGSAPIRRRCPCA